MIIPVPAPLGGAIVVGESVVTYFSAGQPQYQRSAALRQTIVRVRHRLGGLRPVGCRAQDSGSRCPRLAFHPYSHSGVLPHLQAYCQIDDDGSRFLLGDYLGGLHLLVLACVDGSVVGLKLQSLGTTSAANALVYLDNGVAFVGSRSGDHQLIRLHAEPINIGGEGSASAAGAPAGAATGPAGGAGGEDGGGGAGAGSAGGSGIEEGGGSPCYVEVLDSFTSLAPILDFAVQDMDRAGQGQLVMCCGTLRDGSLRVVRNGIGLNELNCVELAGIRGVWALRPGWRDAFDRLLVMAFVGETRVR
jgi:DNA damage-binding protein 1